MKRKYDLIVIGTSSGGLNALRELLTSIPGNFNIPIVIVQHRAKDSSDLLEKILQTSSALRIKQADEKEPIMKGTVYVAPADYHLLIEDDLSFSLSVDPVVSFSRPSIDVLFETAAQALKGRVIGIILTGANSDGAEGIKKIHQAGGLTIVQNPKEAAFDLMPRMAINTNVIDKILTLSEIKNLLLQLNHEQP